MKKAIVIGCPGAGKSVFSRDLAERTGLPLIPLDSLYHLDVWDEGRKKEQWRERVIELVAEPEWIVDGNYKSTLETRIIAADTVVFLDYPRWLCVWRALKRHIEYRNKRRPDMPPEWRERLGREFLRFIWTYRREQRPEVLRLLSLHRQGRSMAILTNPAEADAFLASLRKVA